MDGEKYTYLIIDDGPDGFIHCDGARFQHVTFRFASTWVDEKKSIEEIRKVLRFFPGAVIKRVVANVEPLLS